MRYFEDFPVGAVFELGEHRVTREEILDFARQWDPQPFHVDEEAARHTAFGGLIASGWHTCALYMRLYVDNLLGDAAGMGSPGVDELRWLKPVRPDALLRARFTVLEAKPSERRPDRGTVLARMEMLDEDGEPVLSMVTRGLFGRRPA